MSTALISWTAVVLIVLIVCITILAAMWIDNRRWRGR